MDYLKTQLDAYKDAPQKEHKAKRTLIQALYQITMLNDMIESSIKDKTSFDAHFEKCIGTKSKFVKELGTLSEKLAYAKRDIDIVRNERKKKEAKPKAVVGGRVSTNKVVLDGDEDPKPAVKVAKKPNKKKITLAMRDEIWEKYIGNSLSCLCPVCQKHNIRATSFSAGHVNAEAAGGVTDITNLVPICGSCNSRMNTENLFEYTRKNYMRDPVFPGLKEGK
jgi:hypothetical protein